MLKFNGYIWYLQRDQSWKLSYNKQVLVKPIDDKWLAQVEAMEITLSSEEEAKTWCENNL